MDKLSTQIINGLKLELDSNQEIAKVLTALKSFLSEEFDTYFESIDELFKESITNGGLIPLGYTTLEQEELIDINLGFDLVNLQLVKSANGTNGLDYKNYESYETVQMALESISAYEFDELIHFDVGSNWLINTLID